MQKQLLPLLCTLLVYCANAQFGHPQLISTDTDLHGIRYVEIGDMDQDGDLDIVGKGIFSDAVAWLENLDGQGNFSDPQIIIPIEDSGWGDLKLRDVDWDNDLDVIARMDGDYFWLENQLNGKQFIKKNSYPTVPADFGRREVLDINQDGILDVFTTITLENKFGWYKGLDNDGDYEGYEILSDSIGNGGTYVVDLDLDNDLDVVSINIYGKLSWWENLTGSCGFTDVKVISDESTYFYSKKFADIDSDGDLDITIIGEGRSFCKWFEHLDGKGQFAPSKLIIEDEEKDLSDPFFFDVDGDNHIDLLISLEKELLLFRNTNGTGSFDTYEVLYEMDDKAYDIEFEDLTGDGYKDLIVATDQISSGRDQLFIFKNRGDATFENPVDIISNGDGIEFMQSEDLDGDNVPELITSHHYYGKLSRQKFDNNPKKFTNPKLIAPADPNVSAAGFVDLDGDGDKEAVVAIKTGDTSNKLVWYEKLDGEDNYGIEQQIPNVNSEVTKIKAADFDNDGDEDIFYAVMSRFFWIENLDNAGSLANPVAINQSSAFAMYSDLFDFDNDGDLDLLCIETIPVQRIFWIENFGDGTFSSDKFLFAYQSSLAIWSILYEDIDGDDLNDFLYWDNNTIYWNKNFGGLGNYGPQTEINFQQQTFIRQLVLVDTDLDGDKDIVTSTNLGLFLLENSDGFANFSPEWDILGEYKYVWNFLFEDFDGDRDPDLVIHNGGDRNLYLVENFVAAPNVTGLVYLDQNENGIYDNNEPPISGQKISTTPDDLRSLTDALGHFNFTLDEGTYQFTCMQESSYAFTTDSIVEAEINDDEMVYFEFGLKPNTDKLIGNIKITSGPTKCDSETPFWIDYQNLGTLVANGIIEFELHPLVNFVESAPAPSLVSGNILTWNVQDLKPSFSHHIELKLQMPDEDFEGEIINQSAQLSLTSIDGNHSHTSLSVYQSEIKCVVASNDKLVNPNFSDRDNYTLFGDTLDYTIRFQNTTLETVSMVRIEDYLDSKLDWETFQLMGASHPVEIRMDQQSGRLLFTFNSISLPDSTSNESSSHGFVRYHILPKENLPEFSVVENKAKIFFDFNAAVGTNSVYNILITENPIRLKILPPKCYGDSNGSITVFEEGLYESFEWGDGQTTTQISNLSAGSYQLKATTVLGHVLDTTIILQNPDPVIIQEIVVLDVTCFGFSDGIAEVIAEGGTPIYHYQWNDDFSGPVHDQLSPGDYTVTVTDLYGCTQSDSLSIGEPPTELQITDTAIQAATCFDLADGAITANATGGVPGYTFEWSNGNTGAQNGQLTMGTYTLTLTDSYGCSKMETFEVNGFPEIFLTGFSTPETPNEMNGTATIDASGGVPPYSFMWNTTPIQTTQMIGGLSAGDYTVTLTDSENCTKELTVTVEQTTSINELYPDVEFGLMPNPSKGDLRVFFDLKSPMNWRLDIYNSLGQLINRRQRETGISKTQFYLQLRSGWYIITLSVEGVMIRQERVVVSQ